MRRIRPLNRFPFNVALTIGLCLALACGASRYASADEPDVFQQRLDMEVQYAKELDQLASRCDEFDAKESALETRKWRITRDPKRLYLFLPGELAPRKPVDEQDNSVDNAWHRHFFRIRDQQAERLVELARQALDSDNADKAYQWLHEALHENPDHKLARTVLGYRIVNGRWRLPQGRPRVSTVRASNPRLKFSARRHWRVESEHFSLLTDHSQKEGLQTVEQLEVFYSLWRQAFFRFWGPPGQLKRQLDSAASPRRDNRKFSVVLFRSRDKYLQVLGPSQPLIGKTVGIYLDKARTANFYVDPELAATYRYHEAAHQFFSEAAGATSDVGQRDNFWVVEAIALYMESLQVHDGYYTLGGLDADRTQYARYRAYNQSTYTPLGSLTRLSRDAMQKNDDVRKLYSQSAGLAGYFLDRAAPARRSAFIGYVRDVYRGRARADSLAEKLGAELRKDAPSDVDRDYGLSLMITDEDIAAWPHSELRNLSLGHTQISDRALVDLGEQPRLTWLDLAAVKITDLSGSVLEKFTALEQLNLENTQVTDEILTSLAKLEKLVDLDLSGTEITGAGLKHLAPLGDLQVLWLSGTDVDDDSIMSLRPLKKLQRVHVKGTAVTAAGLKKLKAALPQLQD